MNDLKTVLNPTRNDIDEIEEWLEAEYKVTRTGFFTGRGVLDQSFRENTLIILKWEKKVVSFIAWKHYTTNTARISIAETHPDFRRKGFLTTLLDALIDNFQKNDVQVIDLQSTSVESETTWKQLGFKEFPEDKKNRRLDEKELFKVIIPIKEMSALAAEETLELWHMDTYAISGLAPNAAWNLSFIDGTRILQQPIVYPAHYDWHVCWKKNNTVVHEGRVKRFPTDISFGRFMIVTQIP
ncbi:hypothetical protein AQ505_08825 [Pedobacter sp. PACM 27299]|uniref:GNAT family N-acetyltransferase n=1 Tax=Pedobacter sp. PACM 27299 TaxID=1727164 RepID=UPI00070645F3|nr:GNAT family N-acetyltransferase [Pedobacter sp. PACM 27299]ALL05585.1 hypothetical protein AQ505_08825 [Pedobacter sp. PACM 27299]